MSTSFQNLSQFLAASPKFSLPKIKGKIAFWYLLFCVAMMTSLALISKGKAVDTFPVILALASIGPFFGLLLSKYWAKKAHSILLIDQNTEEQWARDLHQLVARLAERAGLKKCPEVGYYTSPDMNAFATGMSRNSSMVAFSSALIEGMSEEEIAAVAAHEVAHIANGDMLTSTILQSAVNSIVMICVAPLWIVKIAAFFDDRISAFGYFMITLVKAIITGVLMFLGSLVIKAFSRRREYAADQLAAELLSPGAMISALQTLSSDDAVTPKSQLAYAGFKISSASSFMEIFSTHPNIQKRIDRLQNQFQGGQNVN